MGVAKNSLKLNSAKFIEIDSSLYAGFKFLQRLLRLCFMNIFCYTIFLFDLSGTVFNFEEQLL